jgi:alkylhydroperoxidase family enzyme
MTRVQMSRFPIHDEETAPAESAGLLKIASAAGGQLPNFLGVLSNSPAALRAFLRFRQELGKGALDAGTRARIGLAVAAHLGSELPGQERAARAAGLGLDEIARARRWASEEPREAALLRWLKPLATHRGEQSDLLHEEVREERWSDGELLEAIAVVALEEMTANVTRAGDVPSDGSSEETRQLRAVA